MSADEFNAWQIYEQIEPFGDRRADYHAGQIQATLANIHRSEKTRAYVPSDFMPQWEEKPEVQQTPEQQMALMLMLQAAQNAGVNQDSAGAPADQ